MNSQIPLHFYFIFSPNLSLSWELSNNGEEETQDRENPRQKLTTGYLLQAKKCDLDIALIIYSSPISTAPLTG